jgi:hypothetical protein
MNDILAKQIIQKIASSTNNFDYMVFQMRYFIIAHPTYTRRQLYIWIKEVNPVMAEKLQAADYN